MGVAGDAIDQQAEADFKRRDRNGDGYLNEDEMGGRFRREWQQWDTNRDGKIDLIEYKAYYRSMMQARQQQWGGGFAATTTAPVEEEKKPPVYRAGKLPKGIPPWFEKYDTDNDGQVGLYEWRKAGRPIKEFKDMDRDGDGFLTIQEVMRAERLKKKNTKGKTTSMSTQVVGTRQDNRRQGVNFRRPMGGTPQGR
jgi:hypothetical protein